MSFADNDLKRSYARRISFAKWIRRDEKPFYDSVRQQYVNFGSEKALALFKANWDKSFMNFTIPTIINYNIQHYGLNETLNYVFKIVWLD